MNEGPDKPSVLGRRPGSRFAGDGLLDAAGVWSFICRDAVDRALNDLRTAADWQREIKEVVAYVSTA